MAKPTAVGARVRMARKLAGLTQDVLADRMHVSTSLLRKVEQGTAPPSAAFTAAAAKALSVTTYDLYDQPAPRFGEERRPIGLLETAVVAGYDLAELDLPTEYTLAALAKRIDVLEPFRRASRYDKCAEHLPVLIADLHTSAEQVSGTQEAELASVLLARAYSIAAITLYRLGSPLAATAAEKAVEAARRSNDPILLARAQGERALSLMHRGAFDVATRITSQALLSLPTPGEVDDSLGAHAIAGFLHLRLAIIASRTSNQPTSDLHLAEAADHAQHVPDSSDFLGTAFGPSNVQIHCVAAAVELGDGTLAVSRDRPIPPGVVQSRVAHHHVDLARGWLLHGDRSKALASLQTARSIAPQLTRYHPQARETIVALAEQDRRSTETVANLAHWAGVRL